MNLINIDLYISMFIIMLLILNKILVIENIINSHYLYKDIKRYIHISLNKKLKHTSSMIFFTLTTISSVRDSIM